MGATVAIVTPNVEHVPERTYEHDGHGVIICYSVIGKVSPFRSEVSRGGELFRIALPVDAAEFLMNDLYCGEYTGA